LLNKKTYLIFVWIGNTLPDWAVISLGIASKNSNCKVYLLTSNYNESLDKHCVQIEINSFYDQNNSSFFSDNNEFRDGFWVKTTERFFILHQFVLKYKIESFFHCELDNLIFNISHLKNKLDKIGVGLFLPKDNKDRCIASLIYINNINVLNEFCKYVNINPSNLSNDMLLLGDFSKNNENVFFLPNEASFNSFNEINYVDSSETGGIFDAAAIGQYLFGIDPRNSKFPIFNKFVNENLKYDLSKCTFNISISDNIAMLNELNLYNIHVHSKIFDKLINDKWLFKIIRRTNQNKKSLITLNLL